ncbi:DMT family transporter [Methylobacterium sp. J-088]|uniref:DMT family transporter n=1 Tax=Methylobacterium sp. J-088 TaxID=2836664 RepID=UPI001FB9D2E7|nr:DMT family transporter [Methylobacterium sp. J-088]MCJ2066088.1 DMT family transporter [Methylobacterium sp. J-088]
MTGRAVQRTAAQPGGAGAWIDGLIGVSIFSASLVATRLALTGMDALFLSAARAALAGLAGAMALAAFREKRPPGRDIPALMIVAAGVVVGFPVLTALALRTVSAAHGTVFIGLLPLATALFGALRSGERPSPTFWLLSICGALITVGFAARGLGSAPGPGDALMFAAVLVCGLGYAEGGVLARRLGGWQVIAWATVLSLPVSVLLALMLSPNAFASIPMQAWAGLAYVALFSMLIGFVFWYRALARGGIAAIGQLQLLQPFLGLGVAALVLGERIEPAMIGAAAAVALCVALARRFA